MGVFDFLKSLGGGKDAAVLPNTNIPIPLTLRMAKGEIPTPAAIGMATGDLPMPIVGQMAKGDLPAGVVGAAATGKIPAGVVGGMATGDIPAPMATQVAQNPAAGAAIPVAAAAPEQSGLSKLVNSPHFSDAMFKLSNMAAQLSQNNDLTFGQAVALGLSSAGQSFADAKKEHVAGEAEKAERELKTSKQMIDLVKAQNDLDDRAMQERARAVLVDPSATDEQRTFAQSVLDPKSLFFEPTSLEKQAAAIGLQQGTPEFNDFIRKNASKGTNVNVALNQGKIRQVGLEKLAEADAKFISDFSKEALGMRALLPDLDRLEMAVENFPTGAAGGTRLLVSQFADALGVEHGTDTGEGEIIQSIQSRLAPRMRATGSGSSSDKDVQMFLDSLPNLMKTPSGNKMVIDHLRRIIKRKGQESDMMRKVFSTSDSLVGIGEQLDTLGNIFSDDERQVLRGIARGTSANVSRPATTKPAAPTSTNRIRFDATGNIIQ